MVALVLTSCLAAPIFAADERMPNVFEFPDGRTVEYYLDDSMNPYDMINGEKIYLVLPLEHMIVTDPEILSQLNKEIPEDIQTLESMFAMSAYAEPTNYVDLTGGTSAISNKYSQIMYLHDSSLFETPVFKFNRSHTRLIYQTGSMSPASLKRINLIVYLYDMYADNWSAVMYDNIDCTGVGGRFQFSPSITPYGRFMIGKADNITSCSYTVYTDAAW